MCGGLYDWISRPALPFRHYTQLPIGDLATQYFADRKLFCAGRVASDDMARVGKATGGCIGWG